MTPFLLRNWWCPECKQCLASEDIERGRHTECNTKCEWRTFVSVLFATPADTVPVSEPTNVSY